MKLCEKYVHCVELLFVRHKTKKTCRFYYALQKISPARCFSQVFIGWIPRGNAAPAAWGLDSPNLSTSEPISCTSTISFVGRSNNCSFWFPSFRGYLYSFDSIWPSWPSRCLEVSLPDFFDWFAAHIFIATWLQRVDFGWTPTADSFHFSLGFFCRHWCRHCQSGTTISVCYLRSRPAQ